MKTDHPIETIIHADQTFTGKWSGKTPVPKIDENIGIVFKKPVPAKVVGYFLQEGYLGVKVVPYELPENLERYSLFTPNSECKNQGEHAFHTFLEKPDKFIAGVFGVEVRECPKLPDSYTENHLGIQEEYVALLAAILYGRNTWRSKLSEVWSNGTYNRTSYHFVDSILQRIRNTGGWDFIDSSVKKNSDYVNQIRRYLKIYEENSPQRIRQAQQARIELSR